MTLWQIHYWIVEKSNITGNLLFVKSKPCIAAYHQANLCSFSNFSDETIYLLFLSCVNLNRVWDFIIYLLFKLTAYTLSRMASNFFLVFDFLYLNISLCQKQFDAIAICVEITIGTSIWINKNQTVDEKSHLTWNTLSKNSKHDYFSALYEKYRKNKNLMILHKLYVI